MGNRRYLSAKAEDPNYVPEAGYAVETFSYDGLSRMLTADKTADSNDVSLIEYAYNDIGKIADANTVHFGGTRRQIAYMYDQFGFLESTTYPDGSTTIARTNDWKGRIATLSRNSTELVAYDYIGSRVAKRSYDVPGAAAVLEYDNLGRVMDIDYGANVVHFGYSYVADENNIYRKTFDHRSGDPYDEYTYDDLDRLTDVTYHDSDTEAFVMDALGNRIGNQTLSDETVNFTVDSLTNRYTSIGGNSITHDDAGNLTVDKDGYKYFYDYENRVVKIQKPDGLGGWDDVAEIGYDALGRRIRVIDSVASATTLYYYNPEWQCLAEYNGAGALQRYFIYGNYIDEPLAMHRQSDGDDYYYAQDHLYSTAALLDESGNVVERYEYDAYGTTHIMDALYNPRSTSLYGTPYTFTGRRLDVLDGGNKEDMYYRWRYYSLSTNRFVQHDPYGIVPSGDKHNVFEVEKQYSFSPNLYTFLADNPIVHRDPFGTDIYLSDDNNGGRGPWHFINDAFHQKVCVDKWSVRNIDGQRCYVETGKKCFYFGMESFWRPPMGRTWLGWPRIKPPCGATGKIAEDTNVGDGYIEKKVTSVREDRQWLSYMEAHREGLKDTYIPFVLDCRLYAQLEFGDAPGFLYSVVADPSSIPEERMLRIRCDSDFRDPWVLP